MSEKVYPVPAAWKKRALVDDAAYKKMYAASIRDPEKFWAKHAKRIDWFKTPRKIKNTTYAYPGVAIKLNPRVSVSRIAEFASISSLNALTTCALCA